MTDTTDTTDTTETIERRIMICTGAGLSAESGVPTFRDSGGLWEQHKIEDVCTLSTFLENYIKVNEFYDDRRRGMANVEPNAAHFGIAELCKTHNTLNYTTNVDDLLERGGCTDVMHIHGCINQVVHNYNTPNQVVVDLEYNELSRFEELRLYPVKPNVVFFGEGAPLYENLHSDLGSLTKNDILVIIGSSEQVVEFAYSARWLHHFIGPILFVNNDQELVTNMVQTVAAVPFCMSATEFFKQHKIEAFIEELDAV